jgi:circadian clock protein KaiC
MHLALMHRALVQHDPRTVIVDPLTNIAESGSGPDATRMLLRLVDHLKAREITALFTSLTHGGAATEQTDGNVSSIMDAWLLLRDIEIAGERNRVLYLLKSRGMAHSQQVREFRLTNHGVELVDVYVGPGGVLTGSARAAQEAREAEEEAARREDVGVRQAVVTRKRAALKAQIEAMQAELASEEADLARMQGGEDRRRADARTARDASAKTRWADRTASKGAGKKKSVTPTREEA